MSSYQQIFSSPQCAEYNFLYYLSILIGGVWEFFFGWGLSFRFFSVLVILLIFYFVSLTLKDILPNRWYMVLSAILVCTVAVFHMRVIFYDYLSALFVAMAIYFLYGSLTNDSYKKLVIASFIWGINVFVRLPNIALIGMLGILFLVDFYYKRSFSHLWKQVWGSSLGLLASILSVVAIMLVLGHFPICVNCLCDNLLQATRSSASTHNIGAILDNYVYQCSRIGFLMLLYGVLVLGIYVISKRIFQHKILQYLGSLFVSLLIIYGYRRYDGILWSYSLSFLVILASLIYYGRERRIVYLMFLSVCWALFLPLGADTGIIGIGGNSIYLLVPLCCILYARIIRSLRDQNLYRFWKYTGLVCVICLGIIRSYTQVANCAYFDSGSRLEKRYYIQQSALATTLTTREKTTAIDTLLLQASKYIKEGDYLLCFQSMPTIHYLTRTKPYLYNSWPWTYTPESMKKKFLQAEREIDLLPVVIREKGKLPGSDWLEVSPNWDRDDLPDTRNYKHERITLIKQFLHKHGYAVAWENEIFQILLPPSMQQSESVLPADTHSDNNMVCNHLQNSQPMTGSQLF